MTIKHTFDASLMFCCSTESNAEKIWQAAPSMNCVATDWVKRASPLLIRTIADFLKPADVTDMRSFMGLVNHLGKLTRNITGSAECLRPLLNLCLDSRLWCCIWTSEESSCSFWPCSEDCTTDRHVLPYGEGYVLPQEDKTGNWHLVKCGSRF